MHQAVTKYGGFLVLTSPDHPLSSQSMSEILAELGMDAIKWIFRSLKTDLQVMPFDVKMEANPQK